MLYQQAGVHRKVRDCMLGCDAPFNSLRVKGVPGRGRKKRKADSENDNDGPGCDGVGSSRLTRPFQRMEAGLAAIDGEDEETSDPGNDNDEDSN
ncbi:hypothetical protein HAX54_035907 [Datura stramonium]|uniref:Uncharacterized protein n=1 Tax=Datura stramonium TaxID=4076 RepID=A0ABS8SFL8_DATST|nr:hypothetical protein [Datura stramonium]